MTKKRNLSYSQVEYQQTRIPSQVSGPSIAPDKVDYSFWFCCEDQALTAGEWSAAQSNHHW